MDNFHYSGETAGKFLNNMEEKRDLPRVMRIHNIKTISKPINF